MRSCLYYVLAATMALSLNAQQSSAPVDPHYHGFAPGFIVLGGEASERTLIRLVLAVDGAPYPHGWYFTSPTFNDHPLEGRWTEDGFMLTAKNKARFILRYSREHSSAKPGQPLSLEVITTLNGSWSQPSGQRPLTLKIEFARGPLFEGRWYDFGASDAAIEKTARAFLHAVAGNDPQTAARYVDYSLATRIAAKPVKVRTQQEFLNHYKQIFPGSAAAKAAIAVPHDMFSRDGLAMVLDGEVWFSQKGAASVWFSDQP
jgi:hypothetical protein